jgi:hypothetical protein
MSTLFQRPERTKTRRRIDANSSCKVGYTYLIASPNSIERNFFYLLGPFFIKYFKTRIDSFQNTY